MALKEVLVKYSADSTEVTKALSSGEKAAKSAESSFESAAKKIAAFFAVQKLQTFVQGIIDSGAEVSAMSKKFDMSANSFQAWRNAAEASGVNAEKFNVGLTTLAKNAGEAAKAGSPFADVFKQIGVALKGADGKARPFEAVLKDTGLALAKIPDTAKRTALSLQLMGEGGAAMGGLFRDGAAGLSELIGLTDEYGGALSDEAIANAAAAHKTQVKLNIAWESAKSRLSERLLPALAKGVEWFAKLTAQLSIMAKTTNIVEAGIAVAGAALVMWGVKTAAAWGPAALRFVMMGLAIAGAILLADDLITAFKGGKSAVGDFIDKMDGVSLSSFQQRMGEAETFGDKLKEFFGSLGLPIGRYLVTEIWQPLATFFSVFPADVAAGLSDGKAALVTKLTEWGAAVWAILPGWLTAGMSIASALISGLITGIAAGVGKVTTAIKGVAKSGIDAAKGVLGIKSPSKVFAGIGGLVSAGLAGGITAGAPGVSAAAGAVGAGAVQAAYAPVAGASVAQNVNVSTNIYGSDPGSARAVGAAVHGAVSGAQADGNRALLLALDTA